MSDAAPGEIDLARVICRVSDLDARGARDFTVGGGDWPLRGFLVRAGGDVHAWVNRCPHAGYPLNLRPGRFLTADGTLILCSAHGALFEKATGYCVAGACAGRALTRVGIEVRDGLVLLAADVDAAALADAQR